MRKVLLQFAVSLDGYIEGPKGEFDWCFTDQDYGMKKFYERIDALLIGRKTYELMLTMGDDVMPGFPPLKEYVFSSTLKTVKPGATLIAHDAVEEVKALKKKEGKDLWLFGGASLTTALMNANLVDEIILAVHPIILGAGKPLFIDIKERKPLQLIGSKPYDSGLVMLSYKVPQHGQAHDAEREL